MNFDFYRGSFGVDGKFYVNDLVNFFEFVIFGCIVGFFYEIIQVLYCYFVLFLYLYLLIFKDVDFFQLECNLGKFV